MINGLKLTKLVVIISVTFFALDTMAAKSGSNEDMVENSYPAGGVLPAPPPIPAELKGSKRDQAMVPSSQSKNIETYQNCARVINGHNNNIFVPLGSRKEWDRFKAHPPHRVEVGDCTEEELPPGPVEEAVIANRCEDGNVKTSIIKVRFPNPARTCEWSKNGNNKARDGYLQARIEQEFGIDLPKNATMCGAEFQFKEQQFWYDDVFMLSLDNNVLVSSYNWDGILDKQKGFYQYEWDRIVGTRWDHWGNSMDYCPKDEDVFETGDLEKEIKKITKDIARIEKKLALEKDKQEEDKAKGKDLSITQGKIDKAQAEIDALKSQLALYESQASKPPQISSCSFPEQHQVAPLELNLSSDMIQRAMANSGYQQHKMKFVTIGDNDDSDCQHFDMEFDLKITYVD